MKKKTEIKQRSWIDWFCKLIPMSVRITFQTIFIEWRVRLQTIDWTKIPIRFVFSRNSTEAIKLRRQQHSYRWAVVMIVSHTKRSEKKQQTNAHREHFSRPSDQRAKRQPAFVYRIAVSLNCATASFMATKINESAWSKAHCW